ncbi:unnamed protein product, partial [Amoebophrya sp. A120]
RKDEAGEFFSLHKDGGTSMRASRRHRLPFLRILFKARFINKLQRDDFLPWPDEGIAYRPLTSYAGHCYKRILSAAAKIARRIIEPTARRTTFYTQRQVVEEIEKINRHFAETGKQDEELQLDTGDLKDFFTRCDTADSTSFLGGFTSSLENKGVKYIAMEADHILRERLDVHRDRPRLRGGMEELYRIEKPKPQRRFQYLKKKPGKGITWMTPSFVK